MKELVLNDHTNGDEAAKAEGEMVKMGICPSYEELRNRCAKQTIEPGSKFGFQMCACSVSKEVLPHGRLTCNDKTISSPVFSFIDVFWACSDNVNTGHVSINDAMTMLQQSIVGKIPLDWDEVDEKMENIPPSDKLLNDISLMLFMLTPFTDGSDQEEDSL